MEEALAKLGQQPRGLGIATSGKALLQLYISRAGKWTLLATTADGNSCIVATGDDWQELDPSIWGI